MQSGGRFIEQEECLAVGSCREERGQFQSLRLASRERGGRLTEREVVESDVSQGLQSSSDGGFAAEVGKCFFDGHVQHVGDRAASMSHFEHVSPKSSASTFGTGGPDIGQELHVDLNLSTSATHFTSSATGGIETEVPGRVATLPGQGGGGEQSADVVEGLEHGGGYRAGGATWW